MLQQKVNKLQSTFLPAAPVDIHHLTPMRTASVVFSDTHVQFLLSRWHPLSNLPCASSHSEVPGQLHSSKGSLINAADIDQFLHYHFTSTSGSCYYQWRPPPQSFFLEPRLSGGPTDMKFYYQWRAPTDTKNVLPVRRPLIIDCLYLSCYYQWRCK